MKNLERVTSEEGDANEPIATDGTAALEFDLSFQSCRISLRGITLRPFQRNDGEWLEASTESSWHTGRGRNAEAAILSLLASVMDVDGDEIL